MYRMFHFLRHAGGVVRLYSRWNPPSRRGHAAAAIGTAARSGSQPPSSCGTSSSFSLPASSFAPTISRGKTPSLSSFNTRVGGCLWSPLLTAAALLGLSATAASMAASTQCESSSSSSSLDARTAQAMLETLLGEYYGHKLQDEGGDASFSLPIVRVEEAEGVATGMSFPLPTGKSEKMTAAAARRGVRAVLRGLGEDEEKEGEGERGRQKKGGGGRSQQRMNTRKRVVHRRDGSVAEILQFIPDENTSVTISVEKGGGRGARGGMPHSTKGDEKESNNSFCLKKRGGLAPQDVAAVASAFRAAYCLDQDQGTENDDEDVSSFTSSSSSSSAFPSDHHFRSDRRENDEYNDRRRRRRLANGSMERMIEEALREMEEVFGDGAGGLIRHFFPRGFQGAPQMGYEEGVEEDEDEEEKGEWGGERGVGGWGGDMWGGENRRGADGDGGQMGRFRIHWSDGNGEMFSLGNGDISPSPLPPYDPQDRLPDRGHQVNSYHGNGPNNRILSQRRRRRKKEQWAVVRRTVEKLESLGVTVYNVEDSHEERSRRGTRRQQDAGRESGNERNEGGRRAKADWDMLAGYPEVRHAVDSTVLMALRHPETYDAIARETRVNFESNRPRAVLFEGPPGTGKTTTARIIASKAGVPLIYLPVECVVSKWYGQSSKRLASVFDLAEELGRQVVEAQERGRGKEEGKEEEEEGGENNGSGKKEKKRKEEEKATTQEGGCIIFVDEIDALATSRGGGGEGGGSSGMHEATRRLLSVLLRRLDGFKQGDRTLFIAATNRAEDLDEALLSRFDVSVPFPLPDAHARASILQRYARHLNKKERMWLAGRAMEGMSGRDIKECCQEAERCHAARLIREAAATTTDVLKREGGQEGGEETTTPTGKIKVLKVTPPTVEEYRRAAERRGRQMGRARGIIMK